MAFNCFHCQAELRYEANQRVGRGDSCDRCRSDVHVCRNCFFYDPKVYNECREPMAERVVDKEKRNFCDYFKLGGSAAGAADDEKAAALKKLNDLFK